MIHRQARVVEQTNILLYDKRQGVHGEGRVRLVGIGVTPVDLIQVDVLNGPDATGLMIGQLPDGPVTDEDLAQLTAFFASPAIGLGEPLNVHRSGHPVNEEPVIVVMWPLGTPISPGLIDFVWTAMRRWFAPNAQPGQPGTSTSPSGN